MTAVAMTRRREVEGLGDRLRTARVERGWSQSDLAAESGVSQSAISKIERGDRPHPGVGTLAQLETALGRSLTEDGPTIPSSLVAFMASDLGRHAALTPEEIGELAQARWYPRTTEPTTDDWYEYVRLWREMRGRRP